VKAMVSTMLREKGRMEINAISLSSNNIVQRNIGETAENNKNRWQQEHTVVVSMFLNLINSKTSQNYSNIHDLLNIISIKK
jgi:hypothetical protein